MVILIDALDEMSVGMVVRTRSRPASAKTLQGCPSWRRVFNYFQEKRKFKIKEKENSNQKEKKKKKERNVCALVLLLLNAYRAAMRCILKCQGKTFESVAAERVVSGGVVRPDTLKAAGASLNAPGCPGDAFNQAEGYRYLTRLLRVALENFVECSILQRLSLSR